MHQHQRLLPERLNVLQHAGKLRGNQKWWGDNRLIETLTGVEESNKKKKNDEMKNAEVNYIISWLHAHTQTLSFNPKEVFQGINYLPLTLSSVLGMWAFIQIMKKEDVKWSLQTGSWSTVRAVVIMCWGQICRRVVYSVLANTLKTPLIAQHLVCAGGLRAPGNPFSKQPIKKNKKKTFRHVIWHTSAHSYQRERWLTKSSGAWKKTQGEGKAPPPLALIAALSDCGSLTVGVSAMLLRVAFKDQRQTSEGRR